MLLMGLGCVGDLLWLFYWVPFWGSSDMKRWTGGLHTLVEIDAVLELVLKGVILASLLTVNQKDLRNALGVRA